MHTGGVSGEDFSAIISRMRRPLIIVLPFFIGAGLYLALLGALATSGAFSVDTREGLLAQVIAPLLGDEIPAFPSQSHVYFPSVEEVLSDGDLAGELIFVGDIMLSRKIGDIMEKQNDWTYPFHHIADTLYGADIAFGNLESQIGKSGTKVGSEFSFHADPRTIEGLLFAGFDVLSVANNHAWDYGPLAFAETLTLLRENSIAPVGGGENYSEAHEPFRTEVRGTKIAYLAYTNLIPKSLSEPNARPAVAYLELGTVTKDIEHVSKTADVVIVSLHWGDEYETESGEYQKLVGRALIDAGADLIIGHHPHVPQEIEEYGGGVIFYSLGNFVFDQNFGKGTEKGILLKVYVQGGELSFIEPVSIRFSESYQPVFVE